MTTPTVRAPRHGAKGAFAVLSMVAALLLSGCSTSAEPETPPAKTPTPIATPEPSDAIELPETDLATIQGLIDDIKKDITLPLRVDDSTVVIDIRAEKNTVHYFYLLNDVDPNLYSDELLKDKILPNVCTSVEAEPFLVLGVRQLYSYEIAGTGVTYHVEITNEDCD